MTWSKSLKIPQDFHFKDGETEAKITCSDDAIIGDGAVMIRVQIPPTTGSAPLVCHSHRVSFAVWFGQILNVKQWTCLKLIMILTGYDLVGKWLSISSSCLFCIWRNSWKILCSAAVTASMTHVCTLVWRFPGALNVASRCVFSDCGTRHFCAPGLRRGCRALTGPCFWWDAT